MTTTGPSGKRVGRKSHSELHLPCVFLAQKYYRNGARPMREVARLLAEVGYAPRSGIYGPAAIRKMVTTQLAREEVRFFEVWWRSNVAEYVLERHAEYHRTTAEKRNRTRQCFQWLKE